MCKCVRIPNGVLCVENSYTEAMIDGDRRLRRGERQLRCDKCKLYYWPKIGHACAKEATNDS